MILVPYEDEVMYYCSKLRSNFLLDNCFEVKKSQTLFSVEGCNVVVMINAIVEQVLLGEYQLKPLAIWDTIKLGYNNHGHYKHWVIGYNYQNNYLYLYKYLELHWMLITFI